MPRDRLFPAPRASHERRVSGWRGPDLFLRGDRKGSGRDSGTPDRWQGGGGGVRAGPVPRDRPCRRLGSEKWVLQPEDLLEDVVSLREELEQPRVQVPARRGASAGRDSARRVHDGCAKAARRPRISRVCTFGPSTEAGCTGRRGTRRPQRVWTDAHKINMLNDVSKLTLTLVSDKWTEESLKKRRELHSYSKCT